MSKFILTCPSSRGLSFAITRYLLNTTPKDVQIVATTRNDVEGVKERLLHGLEGKMDVNEARLKVLRVDVTDEESIQSAALQIPQILQKGTITDPTSSPRPTLTMAFLAPGILYPERSPSDFHLPSIIDTFKINVIAHMLLIKHFSQFLPKQPHPSTHYPVPSATTKHTEQPPSAIWIHLSARVGSITDNSLGGWYSYRSSKAALNQLTKTFDIHLRQKKIDAMCIGMHPGTVRTDLSKDYWESLERRGGQLMEKEEAARRVVEVVRGLSLRQRGKCWDWKGEEILP